MRSMYIENIPLWLVAGVDFSDRTLKLDFVKTLELISQSIIRISFLTTLTLIERIFQAVISHNIRHTSVQPKLEPHHTVQLPKQGMYHAPSM